MEWGVFKMRSQEVFAALNKISAIPSEELRFFEQQLEWKIVNKGDYLLKSGEVCRHFYYCAKGIFRMFYTTHEGADYNKNFFTEGQFFTSYSSIILGTASNLSIQALEDSEIAIFSQESFEQLYERHRCWETLGRKLAEGLYIKKEQKERQLLFHSAEERYTIFLNEFPGLDQLIPQYHIAFYLGISPVSLSRIKSNL